MPVITKEQALELLTNEVQEKLGTDELLEVYNEVFPDNPYTAEEVKEDSWPLIEQLVDHINGGLEIDEVMDLWGLIFPKHRNVWYDDEEEPVPASDIIVADLTDYRYRPPSGKVAVDPKLGVFDRDLRILDPLRMSLVQSVGDSEDGREPIHGESGPPRERRIRRMIGLRTALAVVPGNVGHDLKVHPG